MKKNLYCLFAMMMAVVLCAGFTSCGDDDEPGGKPGVGENTGDDDEIAGGSVSSSALVGTWQWTIMETRNSDGTFSSYSTLEDNWDYDLYLHFNEDKTGVIYTRDRWNDTWIIKPLEYDFTGEILTIITESHMYGGDYEIISFTESELKFEHANHSRIDTFEKVSDSVIAGAKE